MYFQDRQQSAHTWVPGKLQPGGYAELNHLIENNKSAQDDIATDWPIMTMNGLWPEAGQDEVQILNFSSWESYRKIMNKGVW